MLLKPTSEPYGQGMKALRFRCRREGLLPSSCNLDNDNENPINPHYERIGFGGFSDVYKGRRGTTIIAIKSLRITHDERRNIEKVTTFTDAIIDEVLIELPELSERSYRVEMSLTSKHRTVHRYLYY